MLKWIIELLKRIFMQPESTDRTTEDTNVDEKKILSKATIDTTKTAGAYFYSHDGQENITYLKTGNNNYCIEGYFGKSYTVGDVVILRPLNHINVSIDTGKILEEGVATENSFVNPEGNFVNIAYRYMTTDSGLTDIKAYRIAYATAVTKSSIW